MSYTNGQSSLGPTVFRGAVSQIPLTAAAHFRVHCADFGPVMPQNFSIIVTSNYKTKILHLNFEAVVILEWRWMAYTEPLCR